jgi:hypothetical protein
MKKLILTSAIAVFTMISLNTMAQGKFKFGAGAGLALPVGDLGKSTSFGFGVDVQGTYVINEKVEAFAQSGYASFSGKDGGDAVGHIPFLLGARYVAGKFLGGLGIGYGTFTFNGESGSGLSFCPQLGYRATEKIDILAQYSSTSDDGVTLSFLGLKGIYNF